MTHASPPRSHRRRRLIAVAVAAMAWVPALFAQPAAAEATTGTWLQDSVATWGGYMAWAAPFDARFAAIATDASGGAAMAFVTTAPSGNNTLRDFCLANYTTASSWGPPLVLRGAQGQSVDPDEGAPPAIASAPNGTFWVVWAGYYLYVRRFVAGTGWEPTYLQAPFPMAAWTANSPDVAYSSGGRAFVVWEYSNGGPTWEPRMSTTDGNSPWSSSYDLNGASSANARHPRVVADSVGNALLAWIQDENGSEALWSSRFTPAGGLGAAARVETLSGMIGDYQLAIDGTGNVTAVWDNQNGSINETWANRFVPGNGWGTPARLDAPGHNGVGHPSIAADAGGNVTAIWPQQNGARWSVQASRFAPAAGWGTAAPVSQVGSDKDGRPRVAATTYGRAMAVWAENRSGLSTIWSSLYSTNIGWGAPARVDQQGSPGTDPLVATATNGSLIAVWRARYQGVMHYWSSRFIVPPPADLTPPQLSVDSPTNNTTLALSAVRVAGRTEPGASLQANGVAWEVAQNGSFSIVVPLVAGANNISITARDGAGNMAWANVTIYYDDALPPLLAQLAQLEAWLNQTNAALNATTLALAGNHSEWAALNASLVQASAALAAATTNYEAANATASNLTTSLALATQALVQANAENAATLADLEAANAAINTSRADLDATNATIALVTQRLSGINATISASQTDVRRLSAELNSTRASQQASSNQWTSANGSKKAADTATNSTIASAERGRNRAQDDEGAAAVEGNQVAIRFVVGLVGIGAGAAVWATVRPKGKRASRAEGASRGGFP